jgi:hypothetical protein
MAGTHALAAAAPYGVPCTPLLQSVRVHQLVVLALRQAWQAAADADADAGAGAGADACVHTRLQSHALMKALQSAATVLRFPNAIFIVNSFDNYNNVCGPDPSDPDQKPLCRAPIFSLIKRWDEATWKEHDIIVPQMLYRPYGLYRFPWVRKKPKAFFRGTAYCYGYHHGLAYCSRVDFSYQTHYCPVCSDLIDAGGVLAGWHALCQPAALWCCAEHMAL